MLTLVFEGWCLVRGGGDGKRSQVVVVGGGGGKGSQVVVVGREEDRL